MSSYFFLALTVYSAWNIWIIADRLKRYPVKKHPFKYSFDILFFVLMVQFLAQGSSNFLIIGFLSVLVNGAFGLAVEIFRPEMSSERNPMQNVMDNYWSYVVSDAFIILITYLIDFSGRYHG